jgi:hypothetical protein
MHVAPEFGFGFEELETEIKSRIKRGILDLAIEAFVLQ